MTHEFDRAEVRRDESGNWLCLHIKNAPKARNECDNLKPDKTYSAVIKLAPRSNEANALYWELCGKLAQAVRQSPEEVYKQHVREIGYYELLCMKTEAVESFAKSWTDNHTGRFIDVRVSKIPGCTTVLAYHGSSDYDKQQMSMLIDNCIQDCKAAGVETAPPEEIARLKEGWK